MPGPDIDCVIFGANKQLNDNHSYLIWQRLVAQSAQPILLDVLVQRIEQVPRIQIVAGVKDGHLLQTTDNVIDLILIGNFFASNTANITKIPHIENMKLCEGILQATNILRQSSMASL